MPKINTEKLIQALQAKGQMDLAKLMREHNEAIQKLLERETPAPVVNIKGLEDYIPMLEGEDGQDGVSVVDAKINADGELLLFLDDSTEINVGRVTGENGADGKDGKDGRDGRDGLTPIKGIDYFTKDDKEEITTQTALSVESQLFPEIKKEVTEQTSGDVIVDKLEALEDNDRLDYSAIKNTPDFLTSIEETKRELAEKIAVLRGGVSISSAGTRIGTYHDINFANSTVTRENGRVTVTPNNDKKESIIIAVSDETTALTTGTAKTKFRIPWAGTIDEVRASVSTAPAGADIEVDINKTGTGSILSTVISVDAGDTTSKDSANQPVISTSSVIDDQEFSIDIDQVGSSTAGAGLKVTIIGTRT